jgi:hypothetical protein
MILADHKTAALSVAALALAAACAAAALVLLDLMRRAVGPLRSGKPKPRR